MYDPIEWQAPRLDGPMQYRCHYCDHIVGADKGWSGSLSRSRMAGICICPSCWQPTYFSTRGDQIPSPRIGRSVAGITDEGVELLYNQARDCTMVGAFTGAVLLCRKLLMNIAVQHGATPRLSFVQYVDYLNEKGYVPPNGKPWVDQIRSRGNDATHEIPTVSRADAVQILRFAEMLLRFVYEFPSMLSADNRRDT
jgi:hypothetical protein